MRFLRISAVVVMMVASVLLSSCAAHSKDYLKKDQQINGIVVPPGIPMVKQDTYYPVPNNVQPAALKSSSLVPPTMQADTHK